MGSGQSPFTAWRSVWHTPEYLMLMRTSSGPGCWTSISLNSTGPPVFSMTWAICFLGTWGADMSSVVDGILCGGDWSWLSEKRVMVEERVVGWSAW